METWKKISGFKNYSVSSLGRIRNDKFNRILTQTKDNRGYYRVTLSNDGVRSIGRIHRIVAQEFIPQPEGLDCVNHKDEIKTNNRVENLEWCTVAYNNSYGTNLQRTAESIRNKPHTSIGRFSLGGMLEKVYNGFREVEEDGFNAGNVSSCCNNKKWHKTSSGYIWKFLKDGV